MSEVTKGAHTIISSSGFHNPTLDIRGCPERQRGDHRSPICAIRVFCGSVNILQFPHHHRPNNAIVPSTPITIDNHQHMVNNRENR